jgi:hypothetical protein
MMVQTSNESIVGLRPRPTENLKMPKATHQSDLSLTFLWKSPWKMQCPVIAVAGVLAGDTVRAAAEQLKPMVAVC